MSESKETSSFFMKKYKNHSQFCGRKLKNITHKTRYRGVGSIFSLYLGSICYNQQNYASITSLVSVIWQKRHSYITRIVKEYKLMMEENPLLWGNVQLWNDIFIGYKLCPALPIYTSISLITRYKCFIIHKKLF